ncbi:hypothetical protein G6F31_018076 [Rhizopus arrhizus]|nr:hypothetical protein G6F31_018076 [Rhizopus arrhizus]
MLATATHDHKRGEDTRARLAVLSEAPDEWIALAQALVGAWPLTLPPEPAEDALADYLARIAQWQEKALREAKLRTSWTDPDAAYEQSAARCLDALKHTDEGRLLLREIADYTLRLAPAGLVNGLAQTLLRCTLPGPGRPR